MPLDKLVFIIVCVLSAAAVTVYVGVAIVASTQLPPLLGVAVLAGIALCLYIAWRVIAERVQNKDDDHYDQYKH